MASSKVHPQATILVNNYIEQLPEWSKKICQQLRNLILSSSKIIQEDWKRNHPHYYCNGMVCGIWAFPEYVALVFFQGALIEDLHAVLTSHTDNLNARYIKILPNSPLNENIIRDYINQSINNNMKGIKINQTKIKTIEIPPYIQEPLKNSGLLESFNNMSYAHKKEYILWIKEAKKETTRTRRIEKLIEKLRDKFGFSLH